jgi:hypothetical protein
MNYFNFSCNALYYIIIQLTPHWGFSVTDYIKYYDYLICYLLSLDYLSLQQSRYYFPNCVYPNPPCQLSLWEETGAPGENPRLSAERWPTLFTWVRSENRTHDLRDERRLFWRLRHRSPWKVFTESCRRPQINNDKIWLITTRSDTF